MKLVATVLVAAFVLAGGMSLAFADCAGHNKAQLVQTDDSQTISDRQANNNEVRAAGPEKVVQQTKNVKSLEKK
jgi:hypothetical protein